MISRKTIATLESNSFDLHYILGCRMRREKDVREKVLPQMDEGGFQEVHLERSSPDGPLLLRVKEVMVDERRYIMCNSVAIWFIKGCKLFTIGLPPIISGFTAG